MAGEQKKHVHDHLSIMYMFTFNLVHVWIDLTL